MLILLYLTLVFQEEINIVKGIHQTVFLVAIDFKRLRMASSHIRYRLVGHIHLNLGLWVGKHCLEKFLLELLAHDDRQHEAVEKIVAVNVGKGTADNHTHAIAGNGPCSMLTTGT